MSDTLTVSIDVTKYGGEDIAAALTSVAEVISDLHTQGSIGGGPVHDPDGVWIGTWSIDRT